MKLSKIISGGQTVADQGGLFGARILGIPTGGWVPKDYFTENGCSPDLLQPFSLVETSSKGYQARTELNILDSDGTLIIAKDLNSVGTRLTLTFCKHHGKPYLFIPFPSEGGEGKKICKWISRNTIYILNIAGNRESVAPGIQTYTELLITETFKTSFQIERT